MGNSMEKSFDASNDYLIIVELGLTEDEILHNMKQSIANFDPNQMYTEASDYNLPNVDRIRFL